MGKFNEEITPVNGRDEGLDMVNRRLAGVHGDRAPG
jgi:hypothetical protein